MGEFISELVNGLPAGAYGMYSLMGLVTLALVRCSLHPTVFALVAWPGTLAHELSHWALGAVLGGKPQSMTLWPKSLGNGSWQLGGVSFTNLKWWSAPWTAMAPMLLAPLSLVLAYSWAYPHWAAGDIPAAAVSLYICATILQASWPSAKDFEVAFPGLVVIGAIVAIVW
jgi:hypothetical protein